MWKKYVLIIYIITTNYEIFWLVYRKCNQIWIKKSHLTVKIVLLNTTQEYG